MHRIRIIHETRYHYTGPVHFGPHQVMMRPREGHDLHIESAKIEASPTFDKRWIRDVYGNSIAILTFKEPADSLRIYSEMEVNLYDDDPREGLIDPDARFFPFHYRADEQMEIMPYRVPSYPHDAHAMRSWLEALYQPGQVVDTFELLQALNTRIYESFQYQARDEAGVQVPCRTLALGSGSCRDYAVFMMEAARHLGFAARFVTGYILMGEGQHGATHAWTEIYVPGTGWRGFDPTNNKMAGAEHVSVAVAREQDKAMPLSGSWSSPDARYDSMFVSVQVYSEAGSSAAAHPSV